MRVFLTKFSNETIELDNVQAIDSVTQDKRVRIRTTGVRVLDSDGSIVLDEKIDLSKEVVRK